MKKNKEFYLNTSDNVTAIIEKGCEFKGDLVFEGIARLGGKFEGNIFTNDVFVIEETAFVKANVKADTVIISGKFIGDIDATSRIEIFNPAVVKGNMRAPVISIEEGVVFEGTTRMQE